MDHQKSKLIEIINNNDINSIQLFIRNNKVKNFEYDLLTLAIENNASLSFVKLILTKYNSVNYSFVEPNPLNSSNNDNNINKLSFKRIKNPLFSAIASNNFKLADFLIKNYNADINSEFYTKYGKFDVISYLYCEGDENISLLNKKNIIYILTHRYIRIKSLSNIVKDMIVLNKPFFMNLLETILSYTVFNNDLIKDLLILSSSKVPISDNQFLSLFEKYDIVNCNTLYVASVPKKFHILKTLLEYKVSSREEFYKIINEYYLIERNIKLYGYNILQDVLKYKVIDFSKIYFENLLLDIVNQEKLKNIKVLLHDVIYHPSFNITNFNLEQLFKEAAFNDEGLEICYYIVDLIFNHPILQLNKLNLEYIFLNIINDNNNKFLIKQFMEKLFQYKYDFSLINFETLFKEISYNPYGNEFMEYFLNLLYKTHICSLNEINFKLILEESYKNMEYYNTDMSKYLLKLNFNISDNDFEDIDISELKKCNSKFLCMIINIIIEMGNYDLIRYILEHEAIKTKIEINLKDINDNYPILVAFNAATHLAHPHTIEQIKIFKYLIDYGADINILDSNYNHFFIIALYVQNYLLLNYIINKNLYIPENIINRHKNFIISAIYHNDLNSVQTLFPMINSDEDDLSEDSDTSYHNTGDDNFDFYYRIKDNEINVEKNKTLHNENFIEELLKSDNIDEEFNKFISLEDDIKNLNCNDFTSMNLKPDTTIIRIEFPPLILSYLLDKKKLFKYFLDHCDINEVDTLQYSILHYAVLKEDVDVIKILLEKGANVNLYQHKNGRGHSAFDIAIAIGNEQLFNIFLDSGKVLLDQCNQKKETPLTSVINHRLLELETKMKWIKKLIDKGANVDLINVGEYCALAQTIKCHSLSLMKFLVEECNAKVDNYDQNNDSPLIYAILEEDVEMIQYLIDHGANVNHTDEEKQTPLEIAIRWGSVPSVKILLESGADVNIGMLDYNGKDISLLSYALQVHEPEIANYLIKYGADWNYKNSKNETIYDIAYEQVDKDNLEVMKILADHDINGFKEKIIWDTIKYEDEDHITFFKFLIENKIDINIRDKDGNTPLGIAIVLNNEELVDYLLKNNADISNINNQNKNIYELAIDNVNDNNDSNKIINNDNNSNEHNNNINTKDCYKAKSILQKLIDIDIKNKLK